MLEGLSNPVFIAEIIAEGSDEIGFVKIKGLNFSGLGEIDGTVTGDGGAGAVASEEEAFASLAQIEDEVPKGYDLGADICVKQGALIAAEIVVEPGLRGHGELKGERLKG